MQLLAASPYEKGNRSCVLEFLPYEKFLALWRGSLPADLVYELQFSFNFQLPVVKDQDDPERGRSRKQQTLVHALRSPDGRRRVSPSLPEGRCLLRKEVIQPLVPQRLPCYDFIPITTHTLGRQMPDFGCADGFHDVTGGVYKARERIHGAVADAPLLANPTSRGRVADPDLNWGRLSGVGSTLRSRFPLYRPL